MKRVLPFLMMLALSCTSAPIRIHVIDPGHFHAALVQKYPLPGVDSLVQVHAPQGPELERYLAAIDGFNHRADQPTGWKEVLLTGDPRETLPPARGREVVVLAGNNRNKARYLHLAVSRGYHVLADKPLALTAEDLDLLEEAYRLAAGKGLVIQELMTERTVAGNQAVRAWFSRHPVPTGTPQEPAIRMRSVHHFYKNVDGQALMRPWWYYDIRCQGEGIADVTTHYIDMIFTQCFPDQTLTGDDVRVLGAAHWPTPVTREQFCRSTGETDFPAALAPWVRDGVLEVMANGYIDLCIKGVYARIEVIWENEGTDLFEAEYAGFEGSLPADPLSHEDHFRLVMEDFLGYVRGDKVQAERERINTLTKYRVIQRAVQLADGA